MQNSDPIQQIHCFFNHAYYCKKFSRKLQRLFKFQLFFNFLLKMKNTAPTQAQILSKNISIAGEAINRAIKSVKSPTPSEGNEKAEEKLEKPAIQTSSSTKSVGAVVVPTNNKTTQQIKSPNPQIETPKLQEQQPAIEEQKTVQKPSLDTKTKKPSITPSGNAPSTNNAGQPPNIINSQPPSQNPKIPDLETENKYILPRMPLQNFRDFQRIYGADTIIESHNLDQIKQNLDDLILNQIEIAQEEEENAGQEITIDNFQFNDHIFKNNINSFAQSQEELPPKLYQFLDKVIFNRIKYIAEEAHNMRFFEQGNPTSFYAQNIQQGQLQNLDFFNALAMCCASIELFKNLCCLNQNLEFEFDYHNNGLYCFKFYQNRFQTFTVTVDDYLPVLELPNGQPFPIFARAGFENEFWPSLIEKAYAKLHGSYQRLQQLSLREMINDLTGLQPEIINFVGKDFLNVDNFLKYLLFAQGNKTPIGFMKIGDVATQNKSSQYTPLNRRIYVFKRIDPTNQTITIINPWWGTTIKKGAQAPFTIDECEQQREYALNYDDFFDCFNCICIVQDYPQDFRGVRLQIDLQVSNGIPSSTNVGWVNNPQYILNVSDPEVLVVLAISDVKGVVRSIPPNFGIVIFKVDEKGDRQVKTLNLEQMVLNIRSGIDSDLDSKFAFDTVQLKKGMYSLIPFTSVKGEGPIYLVLEMVYKSSQDTGIAIEDQTLKIDRYLEYSVGSSQDIQFRKLKDALDPDQINNHFGQPFYQSNAFVPGFTRSYIINTQNQLYQEKNTKNSSNQPFKFFLKDNLQLNCVFQDFLNFHQSKLSNSLLPTKHKIHFLTPIWKIQPTQQLITLLSNMINQVLLGMDMTYADEETNPESIKKIQEIVEQELDGIYDFNFYGLNDQY